MRTIPVATIFAIAALFAGCKPEPTPPAASAPAPTTEAADAITVQPIPTPEQTKQVTLAICVAADDHKGDFEFTPKYLKENGYIKPDFPFTNLAGQPLYIFQQWTADQAKQLKPSDTPIVWTNTPTENVPINVGYMDGRVESQRNKSTVNRQLAAIRDKLMGK